MITKGIGLQGLGMKGNKGYSIGSPSALLKKKDCGLTFTLKRKVVKLCVKKEIQERLLNKLITMRKENKKE
jgi:hypothetical protein